MQRESDTEKLQITEAILREQTADLDALFDGITANMPHCWEYFHPGAEIMMCTAYVRHLEQQLEGGKVVTSLHHPDCDGTCHIIKCPYCAKRAARDKEQS